MEMFVFDTGATITVLIFVVTFLLAWLYMWTPKSNIPGPFAFPIIGNLPLLLRFKESERHLFNQKMAAKYGSVYRLFYGKHMMVFVNGYDAINSVFVRQSNLTTDRPDMVAKMSGGEKGILQENGPVWKSLRRISLQSMRDFGVGKKSLGETINEEAKAVMEYMKSTNGKPFDHEDLWRKVTTNVIHSVVFGFRYDHNDKQFLELLDIFTEMFAGEGTASTRKMLPWLKYFMKSTNSNQTGATDKIKTYVQKQISEHRTTYDPNHCRDFIDIYLQVENEEYKTSLPFNNASMASTILALFAAGTDTTAQTLNWVMLYMLGYPDIQEKCQQEIDKMIGHGRMVCWDDKDKLIYVQATLMEIQRLSSIATSCILHVTTGDVHVDGYVIPKGTIIRGNITSSLLDSKCWNEPMKFKPERFIGSNGKLAQKDGFIPFFTGPRMCPGEPLAKMELFLVFSNILQRFNLEKSSIDTKLDFQGYSSVAFRPHSFQMRATVR